MTTARTQVGRNPGPPNNRYDLDLDDIARIYVGELTEHQHQPNTRAGMDIDRSRRRELRRQLVRKSL